MCGRGSQLIMNDFSAVLAASNSYRTTGAVLSLLVVVGFVCYVGYNYINGRGDIGAETELAANKKPYLSDDELETTKLDQSLTMALVFLAIIAVGLPLYWLGEPGRHDGYVEDTFTQQASRGGQAFEELCAACHAPEAVGGVASYTVLDSDGRYIADASWNAPALDNVFYRFSEDEVRYVLNFGRPNSPMPAWGAPGGGPLTTQQIDELLYYLESIQLTPDEIAEQVDAGVELAARTVVLAGDTDFAGDQEAIEVAVADYVANASAEQYGELLFNNPIAGGSYSCARCHTAGWSWGSNAVGGSDQPFASLIPLEIPGGGGYGPNLTGGSTVRQFGVAQEHADFIAIGSQDGVPYGATGTGDGGGQMPGFGTCIGDRDTSDLSKVFGFCDIEDADGATVDRGGLLSPEQVDAIVAYERSL